MKWDLTAYYTGFDDPQIQKDLDAVQQTVDDLIAWKVEGDVLAKLAEFYESYNLVHKLHSYGMLIASVDATNTQAKKLQDKVTEITTKATKKFTEIVSWIGKHNPPADEMHKLYVKEIVQSHHRLFSQDEEELLSQLLRTGPSQWEELYYTVVNNTEITVEDKTFPVGNVRDYEGHSDADIRKEAFTKAGEAYTSIQDQMALSLNNIKGNATYLAKRRKYTNLHEQALESERISPQILEAMWSSVKDHKQELLAGLVHKKKLLGRMDFCDTQAPIVPKDFVEKEYSIEECQSLLLDVFKGYSQDLHDFSKKAFDNNWTDWLPQKGKRSGAFCMYSPGIKESRILTNFIGTYDNISTVAHELGHAYNYEYLQHVPYECLGAPYSLLECPSNFNEILLVMAMLKRASKEERVVMLSEIVNAIFGSVTNMYVRYDFEKRYVEERENGPLGAEEINALMKSCQEDMFGDVVDTTHDWYWMYKLHYFRSEDNFYNFPYAVGYLLAIALYVKTEEDPTFFDTTYRSFLEHLSTKTFEELGELLDIDFASQAFWDTSIQFCIDRINEFIEATPLE